MSFAIHPAATVFPPMTDEEFEGLVTDMQANGQREPIVLHEGAVLDGVHRLKACERLGREPLTREWAKDHGDPVAYVISVNLHRRHLSSSQRAMIAERLANLKEGHRPTEQKDAVSLAQAAEALHVSRSAVEHARVVRRDGSIELAEAVEAGAVPVYKAARVARRYRKDEQLAQAQKPKAAPKRDPMKPKRLPTVPVLERVDRGLDTLETLMEAVFQPAVSQMRHDARRERWAARARDIRTDLSRFIARCEGA
jgi:ParB-like chromosome segregation protein Spo0J